MKAESKIIELIYTESTIGKGIDGDPIRMIRSYFCKNGQLLFHWDIWANEIETPAGIYKLQQEEQS